MKNVEQMMSVNANVQKVKQEIQSLRKLARDIRYKAQCNPRPGYREDIKYANGLDKKANDLEITIEGKPR